MNQQISQERKVEDMVRWLRWALIAGVVLVGVLGTRLYLEKKSGERNEKAFALLFEAEHIEQAILKQHQNEKTAPDLFELVVKSPTESKSRYEEILKSVVDEYSSSTAADLALLRLARLRLAEKHYIESRRYYSELAARKGAEKLFRAMALEGEAVTYEQEGHIEEALKIYDEALGLKNNPLKALAFMGKARILKSLGKAAEAHETYEKILQEFPGTDYAQKARILMALSGNP